MSNAIPTLSQRRAPASTEWLIACIFVSLGAVGLAVSLQGFLERADLAGTALSRTTWQAAVGSLGGRLDARDSSSAVVPLTSLLMWTLSTAGGLWFGLSLLAARLGNWSHQAVRLGTLAWRWWIAAGAFELVRMLVGMNADDGATLFVVMTAIAPFAFVLAVAGWAATCWNIVQPVATVDLSSRFARCCVLTAAAVYAVTLFTMNWQLYRGLWIPHGDSAMYEEHLWNLLHGKGFRSYLDQGLFLGEHIQFSHALLIPIYLFWPSHLLLELAESLALAAGAVAAYRMTLWHTGCRRAAILMSVCWLLFFPLHYLDIAVDLKTFRPISFGVPFLLFGLERLERGKWRAAVIWFVLVLTCKEEFAIILAMVGGWMVWRGVMLRNDTSEFAALSGQPPRAWVKRGAILGVSSTAYLMLVLWVLLPWFRDGVEIHYVNYFSRFGDSMSEVVLTLLTRPGMTISELWSTTTLVYACALLVPLGGLPLLSPSRLIVGLPIFVLLCLNELTRQPVHHFHAPVVPIIFWAASAGLGKISRWQAARDQSEAEAWNPLRASERRAIVAARTAVCLSALTCGLYSMTPLGFSFWDSGSFFHWKKLYVPGSRADAFAIIESTVPQTARVASTDYVHPRFTHHERSYDYSDYARAVAGEGRRIPEDTDYIVLDTRHYNSRIRSLDMVPELTEEPERWEVVPDRTDGFFIVLRRRDSEFTEPEPSQQE